MSLPLQSTLPALPLARPHPPAVATARDATLWTRAVQLEAAFLAEMLGHAGMGRLPDSFGGGAGEDQFASFLRTAQAESMAQRGGIGLAEHLFRAMQDRSDDR